jgi:arabinofuranan 3-O-arabinosyltransferase
LILEQSWNPGWTASIDGVDLGPPTLIGGYANGWMLPAGGDGRSVELRWTPQDGVRLGLAVSAAGALVVLAILAVTWRRRRAVPEPLGAPARDPLWGRRAVVPALVLVGLFALVGGLAASLATLATLLLIGRWRWLPTLAVLVVGGCVGGAIVLVEWYRDYPAALFWPSRFAWAAGPVWAIVAVAVAAAVFPQGIGRFGRPAGSADGTGERTRGSTAEPAAAS